MSSRIAIGIALLVALTLSHGACSNSGDGAQETGEAAYPPSGTTPPPQGSQPPAGFPSQDMDGRNALMTEFQTIQQQLGQLQQQALTDAKLQENYATLQGHIEDAMLAADPNYAEKENRLEALRQEMAVAQQSGDQEAMQKVSEEGMALQGQLQQLQSNVVQDEKIAGEMEEFRLGVDAKMKVLDPEAPKLIERVNEIATILQGGPVAGEAPPSGGDPIPGQ